MHTLFHPLLALAIGIITFVSGLWLMYRPSTSAVYRWGDHLISGVFLGIGFFHLLPDAINMMKAGGYSRPHETVYIVFILMIGLLVLIEQSIQRGKSHHPQMIGFLVTVALCIHAILGGIALGLNSLLMDTLIIFIALSVHKISDSFALILNLRRSQASLPLMLILLSLFSVMTPLGMMLGEYGTYTFQGQQGLYYQGIFNAMAAGTFCYIGTMDSVLRKWISRQSIASHALVLWMSGMSLMGLLAIWV